MSFQFTDFSLKAKKALDHIQQEIASLRTGRASVQLLDPVTIEAYGTKMKVSEVANISVPDPNLILISPWDKSLLGAIERGIQISGINLSPVVDGQIIRIVVPPLTEERRLEMVKVLHQRVEAGKVMLRTIRTETKKEIEKQKGNDGVSEDDIKQDLETLENKLKSMLEEVDLMAADKQADLMKV
jgi:ribosome recycling factor